MAGLNARLVSEDGVVTGFIVTIAVFETPAYVAVTVTVVAVVTENEVAVNAAVVEPAGTVMLAGTCRTLLLFELRVTAVSLLGAQLRVTVPVVD